MKRTAWLTAAAAGGVVFWCGLAYSVPEPAEVPISWELEFEFDHPKPVLIDVPGKDKPELFWYLRYTITNHTGADRIFVPNFILYAETGQLIPAGRRTPLSAYDTIKRLHNNPLMRDATAMTGKILEGEDNARDSVAIWPDFDPNAGSIDIFVGGLSGETIQVKLPKPIEVTETDAMGRRRTVMKDKMIVKKTLQLRYHVAGEAGSRLRARARLIKKAWVMR